MDSNPIHHPSPAKKIKCSLLDYIHFGWSARLVNGLKPHPPPLSTQKKKNAHFWIMFNFWWSAGLVNGLEPHLPPLSYQKNEMLIFQIHSTCDDQSSWSMDSNPICHTSPTKKMKCSLLEYVQLLMLARLVNELKPHPPPLCSQKNEMLLFWITLNFWWLARFVDGLELHPPPVSSKKMKCSYFDFVKLLMMGRAVQWTRTPSTTPLHPKKWNAHFWIMFNFWWLVGLFD